jgi:hypothetical protein
MEEERKNRLLDLVGLVVLIRKPDIPMWFGLVERSFSIDEAPGRARFWHNYSDGNTETVSAQMWADQNAASHYRTHPDWLFWFLNPHDESLPFTFDWDSWLEAHEYDSKTIAGIKDKYGARNLRFSVKSAEVDEFLHFHPGMRRQEIEQWIALGE